MPESLPVELPVKPRTEVVEAVLATITVAAAEVSAVIGYATVSAAPLADRMAAPLAVRAAGGLADRAAAEAGSWQPGSPSMITGSPSMINRRVAEVAKRSEEPNRCQSDYLSKQDAQNTCANYRLNAPAGQESVCSTTLWRALGAALTLNASFQLLDKRSV